MLYWFTINIRSNETKNLTFRSSARTFKLHSGLAEKVVFESVMKPEGFKAVAITTCCSASSPSQPWEQLRHVSAEFEPVYSRRHR